MTSKTHAVQIQANSPKEARIKTAQLCVNSPVSSASILIETNKGFEPDINALIRIVEAEADKVTSGDMSAMEAMLVSQAYTLQSVFTEMMKKTVSSEYLKQTQTYSRIALKAQNQCRQTLAALSEMRNPKRTTFIKNQATNQQVNFNSEKNKNESNELLSEVTNEEVGTCRTGAASAVNQDMETVGE